MLSGAAARGTGQAMTLEVVLITGMSGSGKSVALRALEDAGYYCVDNLPPELLLSFVALEQQSSAERVAIAMDVRSATSLPLVPAQLRELRRAGRHRAARCSWTPPPTRWCGASPKRGAAIRCRQPAGRADQRLAQTSSTRWSMPSSSSANCWPTCASRRTSSTPA